MINLKYALVSADTFVGPVDSTKKTNWVGDFWGFYSWTGMFRESFLYSFEYATLCPGDLDKYDLIMFTAHPAYLDNIINLASGTKAVTIWFPDGQSSAYFDGTYGGVSIKAIQSMNACSVVGVVEEDRLDFFGDMLKRPVKFIHIPVPTEMINGCFINRASKNEDMLIYGDNNPNNPLTAIMVAKRTGKSIATTQISDEMVNFARSLGIKVSRAAPKQDNFPYMTNWVAPSKVLVYPTRWFGTARQPISGALCGTPCVGSRDSHTQMRLFPNLATGIYEIDKMAFLVEQLYTYDNFYKECVDYAFEEVKFYSEENACRRMEEAYEVGRKQIG